ncbi:MAG: c-type cytochrome [Candidatus Marinimicrobia bacterium]|nr:c-type cytochrome [Candidatus Neomarinimicrobiota bacterium]
MAIKATDFSDLIHSSSVESPGIDAVRKSIGYLASAFMALLLLNLPLYAQDWKWPEKPQNIQVLSEKFTGRRLGFIMTGFSQSLGVRCTHCHVGEEGKGFSTYDFPSDKNPNKDRAREMFRMLNDINKSLSKLEPSGDKRVDMSCDTCHRGLALPITLSAQIGKTFRAEGIEASLTQYSELKEKYYGTGAYQFKESILNNLGYAVLSENPEGAVKVFKLNSKEYPKSGNVWDSLADGYMLNGDNKKAKKYYKKSLKLNPDNQNAKDMLKKLEESK